MRPEPQAGEGVGGMRLERKSDPDLLGKEGEFDSNSTKSHSEHALSLGNAMLTHCGGLGETGQDPGRWFCFLVHHWDPGTF